MRRLSLFLLTAVLLCGCATKKESTLKLIYDKPATVWNEALPIGNGRISAMVYGDPVNEKFQLNEATFWSGAPSRNDNSKALEALPKVRQLIFDGKYSEAELMVNQNMVATQLHGSMFQPIGDLNIAFDGHEEYTNYSRELDIERAIFSTTYQVDGVTYKQESFASFPDQLIVIRLTADRSGSITFTANFDGALKQTVSSNSNMLEMTGLSSSHEGVEGKVKFDARAKFVNKGGTLSAVDDKIKVEKANEVVILVSMATNFVDYETLSDDEAEKCAAYFDYVEDKSFSKMEGSHIKTYQNYFDRVELNLGTSGELSKLPTNERIENFSKNNDPELVALYFQFGRYLLISSSQPGGQPANLQGIWNNSPYPAWDSKYTININTEMNYWPAEKCNLSEMHEPLIKMVEELSEAGQETAKTMYGCDGWVVHHNTDIWRTGGVVDGAFWGMWPMGGAWLSQHLWERYLYSGDMAYLDSVYPILKSACEFYQDFLVEEPTHKWLVVCPAISPENSPAGRPSICAGATMDNQILFDLFSKTIKAAKLLGKDESLIADFQKILDQMPPMQVGQYGQLQEWMEDLDNPEDKHRHVSHLYGLYPSNQISAYTTPELFNAARTSLIQRGDVSTGWSMGWKVNLWARLLDGNHAMKLIKDQLTLVDPVNSSNNGGTYPNFFDAHPPFQIDGNFGCTSGIAEMLLQSANGDIHILPALPDEWANGNVSGLRTYGGFELAFEWANGQLEKLVVKSNLGGNCRIRVPNEMAFANGQDLVLAEGVNPNSFFDIPQVKTPLISEKANVEEINLKSTVLYDFDTEAGKTYTLVCKK